MPLFLVRCGWPRSHAHIGAHRTCSAGNRGVGTGPSSRTFIPVAGKTRQSSVLSIRATGVCLADHDPAVDPSRGNNAGAAAGVDQLGGHRIAGWHIANASVPIIILRSSLIPFHAIHPSAAPVCVCPTSWNRRHLNPLCMLAEPRRELIGRGRGICAMGERADEAPCAIPQQTSGQRERVKRPDA